MKYVYVCISFKNYVDAKSFERTRKYKKAVEIQQALGIKNIVVDICTSKNRKKQNLEAILKNKENVIVVSDITSLGKNEEIAAVYQRILETENEILICYFNECGVLKAEEPSTVSLQFEKINKTTCATFDMAGFLSPTQYRKTSTRMLDPRIIEGYWQIERGEKTQREIIESIGTSKNTFIRRIDEYVGTDGWVERYKKEIEDFNFRNSPTKLGNVPADAIKLYEYFEANKDLKTRDECSQGYPIGAILTFTDIELELLGKMHSVEEEKEKIDHSSEKFKSLCDEYDKLSDRYTVTAHHLYRHMLRYRKYLKRLKYRQ